MFVPSSFLAERCFAVLLYKVLSLKPSKARSENLAAVSLGRCPWIKVRAGGPPWVLLRRVSGP